VVAASAEFGWWRVEGGTAACNFHPTVAISSSCCVFGGGPRAPRLGLCLFVRALLRQIACPLRTATY
jgi:hypothetical protein